MAPWGPVHRRCHRDRHVAWHVIEDQHTTSHDKGHRRLDVQLESNKEVNGAHLTHATLQHHAMANVAHVPIHSRVAHPPTHPIHAAWRVMLVIHCSVHHGNAMQPIHGHRPCNIV